MPIKKSTHNKNMGNAQQNPNPLYEDSYEVLNEKDAEDIKTNYKVLKVRSVCQQQVNDAMAGDTYFESQPEKKQVVDDMVEYCHGHKRSKRYTSKPNYICSKKEQICICNTCANIIYYAFTENPPMVAWVKKRDESL